MCRVGGRAIKLVWMSCENEAISWRGQVANFYREENEWKIKWCINSVVPGASHKAVSNWLHPLAAGYMT
jgi:hypothetical protein